MSRIVEPDEQRDAFLLRHHAGEPFERIAQVLDSAPGACRHAVFRAVRKLRQRLRDEASEDGVMVEVEA